MDPLQVKAYYDDFFKDPLNQKINERVYTCYRKMKLHGLCASSSVLELGCGAGTLTRLLAKTITNGNVEAVDISTQAVDFAKATIRFKHVRFYAADIVTYKAAHQHSFDFITLFDVIEHIPLEKHEALFQTVSSYMHDKSLLLINIPNPDYIEYDRIHQPQLLQIIDQPVYLDHLVSVLMKNNLMVQQMETQSISAVDDYQFFIVKKKLPFTEVPVSTTRSTWEKIKHRLQQKWIRYKHYK